MVDILEQAEQNVIKIAKELNDIFEILNALNTVGNKYLKSYDNTEYFEGLVKMRNNIYRRYTEQLADCFTLSGVGGEDAKVYSRERFKTLFNKKERFQVAHLLSTYGHTPDSYKDDSLLRKAAEERLKE